MASGDFWVVQYRDREGIRYWVFTIRDSGSGIWDIWHRLDLVGVLWSEGGQDSWGHGTRQRPAVEVTFDYKHLQRGG
jgi:hypothetical protein